MARYQQIPDHPEIARTLRAGYSHRSRSVMCADCQQEFYGEDKLYLDEGDLVCGCCMKNRLLDAHGIADLAEAFDIQGTTVSEHFALEGG